MGNVWLDIITDEQVAEEAIDELFALKIYPTYDDLVFTLTVWARNKGYLATLQRISLTTDHDSTGWWVVNINITASTFWS